MKDSFVGYRSHARHLQALKQECLLEFSRTSSYEFQTIVAHEQEVTLRKPITRSHFEDGQNFPVPAVTSFRQLLPMNKKSF
ncbi:hypothetical protein SLEP1_g3090 [Rubroshorea leprosula]|uniref:Uncharacterized protein n=1 Tax=Rubroshorea leprosula TaxID=152421 RepID=A0AAV5HRL0_9ROSI|nr:hypothetical protein SLEP1_g3090 [Rubroshorea leprosula]